MPSIKGGREYRNSFRSLGSLPTPPTIPNSVYLSLSNVYLVIPHYSNLFFKVHFIHYSITVVLFFSPLLFIYLLTYLLTYLLIYLQREGKGEKHQCVVAPCMPLTGNLACNPGMCPDWELNQRPFGLQASAQSTATPARIFSSFF